MRRSLPTLAGRERRLLGPPVALRSSSGRHQRCRFGRGWLTARRAQYGRCQRRPGLCTALIDLVNKVVTADHVPSQQGCDALQPKRDVGHARAGQKAFITDSESTAQLHGNHQRVVSGSDYALLPLAPHGSSPAPAIRSAVGSGLGCAGSTSLDAHADNSEPECCQDPGNRRNP